MVALEGFTEIVPRGGEMQWFLNLYLQQNLLGSLLEMTYDALRISDPDPGS